MDAAPNGYINIVALCSLCGFPLPSGRFWRAWRCHFILLPDLSENLDGVHEERYERIKSGGTPLEDISKIGLGQDSPSS
jgi:hypothetical protein